VFLKSISLLNYKNITDLQYDFDIKINSFVGKNGVGKTNVLDAIYHLAYGKSYFNPLASQNIKHGEEFADGIFEKRIRKKSGLQSKRPKL
jgi:DNA replication and repair protein RecF